MGVREDVDRRAASGAGDGAVAKTGGSLLRPSAFTLVRQLGARSHRHVVSHAGGSRKGEERDLRATQTAARNLGPVDCGGGRSHWDGDGAHLGLNKRLSVHDTTNAEGTSRARETDRTPELMSFSFVRAAFDLAPRSLS